MNFELPRTKSYLLVTVGKQLDMPDPSDAVKGAILAQGWTPHASESLHFDVPYDLGPVDGWPAARDAIQTILAHGVSRDLLVVIVTHRRESPLAGQFVAQQILPHAQVVFGIYWPEVPRQFATGYRMAMIRQRLKTGPYAIKTVIDQTDDWRGLKAAIARFIR